MITSSPGLSVASMALKMICLPPEVTTVCDGLYSSPWSRFILAQIAWRSAGVPGTAVYFVSLAWMALMAASLMWSGVGKSGSPAARPITSLPAAFISRNLPWAALVGEGLMRLRRSAMKAMTRYFLSGLEKARESTGEVLFSQAEAPLFLVGSCRILPRPPTRSGGIRRAPAFDPAVFATYFAPIMIDQPDSLVLTLLRDMRGSLQRVESKLDELVRRVSSVETNLAHVHVELAGHSARMDRIDGRLDRIEKRLGLV